MSDAGMIRRFLDVQYGASVGFAWICTKTPGVDRSFTNTSFEWPTEADALVRNVIQEDAAGQEVWYCVHLHSDGSNRNEGNAIERRRLHADIDEVTEENSRLVSELGAWVVYSGSPGHLHVYVDLSESVDRLTYNRLEDSLTKYLGADAKKRDNDILRIPGTGNKKYSPPVPVEWDGGVAQRIWRPSDLAAFLPESTYTEGIEGSTTPIVPKPCPLPGIVATLVNTPYSDRSAKTPKIVNQCAAEGLSLEETLWCIIQDPDQKRRYQEKGAAFMYREVSRLYMTAPKTNWRQEQDAIKTILGVEDSTGTSSGTSGSGVDDILLLDDEDDGYESSWGTVDLGSILNGDYTPLVPTILRRNDDRCLIYPGKTHSMHGEPESGKSLVMQYVCSDEIGKGHHVLYVDFEDAGREVVNRLIAFGAQRDSIREFFHYVRPNDPYVRDDPAWQAVLKIPVTLAVLDGVTESMTANGLELNDNKDVAKWQRMLPNYIVEKTGAAVVSIDHVSKSADSRGRTAIGGQHKMAGLSGAAYVVEPIEPLGKGKRGTVSLRLAKDRLGEVRANVGMYRKSDRTAEACRVIFDSTDAGIEVQVAMFQDQLSGVDKRDRMRAMATNLIGNRPGIGKTAAMLALKDSGMHGKAMEFTELWAYLVEEGYVEIRKGGVNKQGLYLLKPFVPNQVLEDDED